MQPAAVPDAFAAVLAGNTRNIEGCLVGSGCSCSCCCHMQYCWAATHKLSSLTSHSSRRLLALHLTTPRVGQLHLCVPGVALHLPQQHAFWQRRTQLKPHLR